MSDRNLVLDITGGLTEYTNRVGLKTLLSQYGEVDVCWIPPVWDRNKSNAYVKFKDEGACALALQAIQGQQVRLHGIPLEAQYRAPGERGHSAGIGPGNRGDRTRDGTVEAYNGKGAPQKRSRSGGRVVGGRRYLDLTARDLYRQSLREGKPAVKKRPRQERTREDSREKRNRRSRSRERRATNQRNEGQSYHEGASSSDINVTRHVEIAKQDSRRRRKGRKDYAQDVRVEDTNPFDEPRYEEVDAGSEPQGPDEISSAEEFINAGTAKCASYSLAQTTSLPKTVGVPTYHSLPNRVTVFVPRLVGAKRGLGLKLKDMKIQQFEDSACQGFGWHLGDRICEINGHEITSVKELIDEVTYLKSRPDGFPVRFTVDRS